MRWQLILITILSRDCDGWFWAFLISYCYFKLIITPITVNILKTFRLATFWTQFQYLLFLGTTCFVLLVLYTWPLYNLTLYIIHIDLLGKLFISFTNLIFLCPSGILSDWLTIEMTGIWLSWGHIFLRKFKRFIYFIIELRLLKQRFILNLTYLFFPSSFLSSFGKSWPWVKVYYFIMAFLMRGRWCRIWLMIRTA